MRDVEVVGPNGSHGQRDGVLETFHQKLLIPFGVVCILGASAKGDGVRLLLVNGWS